MLPVHRLPVSDTLTAVALHTIGFPVSPHQTWHDRTGTRTTTWWVDEQPAAADNLLAAWRSADPARQLERTAPEHPFLAARYAAAALPLLRAWLEQGGAPPILARTRGRLLRVFSPGALPPAYDFLPAWWAGQGQGPAAPRGVHGVTDPCLAAALLVCGFPCAPALLPPTGARPAAILFPEQAATFGGDLRASALLAQASLPAGQIRTDYPPGFVPGEHPFEYALMGARNAAAVAARLAPAERNPSIWFQAEGTRGALVSQSLLEESHPNTAFRDELHDHLS